MRIRIEIELVAETNGTPTEAVASVRNLLSSLRTTNTLKMSTPSIMLDQREMVVRCLRIADAAGCPDCGGSTTTNNHIVTCDDPTCSWGGDSA